MKRITIGFFVLLMFTLTTQAQAKSEKLAKLPKILREKIGKDLPGWTHRSITPMEGSENVIIEQWESGDVTIKVAVTEYNDKNDAVEAFREFKSQLKTQEDATVANGKPAVHLLKENLPVVGDGGFTWDVKGSEATAFRKGNFTVFVSIARRPQDYVDDRKLSKEFAKRVVEVLLEP